jgi:hypothetical protein
MINRYIIWNPAKCEGVTNYDDLIVLEQATGTSNSSIISTFNITQLINGIENETDVRLCFKLLYTPPIKPRYR